MSDVLTIGTVEIAPGEQKRGAIRIGKNMYGIEREIPIIVYRGTEDGPRLWICGAIHGDEPEGPYSIKLLMDEGLLDPRKMKGLLVLVPAINVEALMGSDRGDPRDQFTYDMNRIYPGKPDGYPSERVAWSFNQVMVDHCDYNLTIHSGGDHSMLDTAFFAPEVDAALDLGKGMGPDWDLALTGGVGPGSPASVLGEMGRGGLTVELGGWCRMLSTDFHEVGRKLKESYINVLYHLGMLEGEARYAEKWIRGHQQALLAGASGIFVGEDVPLRTPLKKGTVIARIFDLYGDEIDTIKAPVDGQIFGLRSRAMVIEGEWCCFYAIPDEVRDDLRVPATE